jgi:Tol biopolymer transport system component
MRSDQTGTMSDTPSSGSLQPPDRPAGDRLDSWKEIAAYLKRDVTTAQRWEKREGMPVHRHLHDKAGSVYAFKADLDAWSRSRNLGLGRDAGTPNVLEEPRRPPRRGIWLFVAGAALLAGGLGIWQMRPRERVWTNPLTDARFVQVTDFGGTEQAAALSRDGRLVAFLSDRDERTDVWIAQVGTGQFYNLTRGAARDIVNPSIRTLGFSPDGTLVTFWARKLDGSAQSEISTWAVPILGGQPRPYLEGVAEFDWSRDASRLVYHTPGPGDPMFVRDSAPAAEARQIFSAPAGLHSHFPLWSPGQDFVYFVQGQIPNRTDIWRIRPAGGAPERLTHHDSQVSYPVFVDARSLLYLATDSDGSGPWIYSVDVEDRVSHRASFGIDRYTSLAASADGRRLVATLASPKSTLWRVPITSGPAEAADARRIALTTGNGSAPRLGSDFLLYVSSTGASDSIWKLQNDRATELWTAPETRIIGAPAIARDGRRIAFAVRRDARMALYIANVDGTGARAVNTAVALQGAPVWAPDGESITVAALVDGVPRLTNIPLDGGATRPFVAEYSIDPAWSPDGGFVVFSGADIGTTFPLKAVSRDGRAARVPALTLTRGARHVAFMGNRPVLVTLRGELNHLNLWSIDLDTGAERQLTNFAPDFGVRDFDISPDGREFVLEQVQDHSDIVLLEMPQR